jgi:hypothetical protein
VALQGTVLRLVQHCPLQGINSLEPLVDNLEQLARLEAMVETSKPPLRHGSRFGSRQYRGMFYGSRSRGGCLVEGAYDGLLFWEGLIDPPAAPIRRRQTLFSLLLNASRGLRLQAIAAEAAQASLRDPLAYGPTQQLGAWMRDHRQITPLSSVTTTASCIVLGASCF